MKKLAPELSGRSYDDLMKSALSRLPGLAPGWTDYNAHDPGITLLELLAGATEAQLYALSRQRRDERRAFAALLGLKPRGPQPAEGLIWPDHRARLRRWRGTITRPSSPKRTRFTSSIRTSHPSGRPWPSCGARPACFASARA